MGTHQPDFLTFAHLSQELLGESSVRTLQMVVDLAVETVPGCDYAGVTMKRHGSLETPAASDPLVNTLDELQYRLGEGPCIDAVRIQDTYVITDTRTETRWPKWAPRASEHGVGSVLSIRLETPRHVVGGLNMYSRAVAGFDDESQLVGHAYAMHAGVAIAATSEIENLSLGLRARHLIGMAQGMLMLRYGLSEQQAFQFLARSSQQENIKLREIAQRVTDELARQRWPGQQ